VNAGIESNVISRSEPETAAAGEALAPSLAAGDVILLHGQLGAGKTAFVRGLARGLGAAPDEVSSPTFTLIQEYRDGRLPLYHVDLYRLEPREIDDLGLDDLIGSGGIVAIEWAERWRDRPANAIEVTIERVEEETRHLRLRAQGSGKSVEPLSAP
jgi:tRNA threonylcarbamoyladenosine biosynthesis protein TsaE